MVRAHRSNEIVLKLQEIGCLVGLDILDVPGANYLHHDQSFDSMMDYIHGDVFDFYIVNNSFMKKRLNEVSQKPCFVIPHHTVNFKNDRTCFGKKLKRLGYLGLSIQLDNLEELQIIANKYDVEIVVSNESTPEGCVQFLSTLDAGVIFLDSGDSEDDSIDLYVNSGIKTYNKLERSRHLKDFKPNTKLSNFQSFGIPTICTEYKSFEEWGGKNYISANNLQEFENAIALLKNDEQLRRHLSDLSYEHGKGLHISHVIELYKGIVQTVT
jgi:hypothetical protein